MTARDARGYWLKGHSGNPAGRVSTHHELQALARTLTPAALEALRKNLTDENGSVRNTAAQILLDRGYGKPPQALTGGQDDDPAIKLIVAWQPVEEK